LVRWLRAVRLRRISSRPHFNRMSDCSLGRGHRVRVYALPAGPDVAVALPLDRLDTTLARSLDTFRASDEPAARGVARLHSFHVGLVEPDVAELCSHANDARG